MYWAEAHIKNRFTGNTLEVIPAGSFHVVLKATNEVRRRPWAVDAVAPAPHARASLRLHGAVPAPQHFVWHRVKTVVHNLIIGSVWVDNYGDMVIRNLKTGDKCAIAFKQRSWWGKNYGEVEGTVLDSRGRVCRKLVGTWLDHVDVTPPDNGAGKVRRGRARLRDVAAAAANGASARLRLRPLGAS